MIRYGWTRQSTVGGFLSWLFTGPHWPQITYYACLCSSPREWENQSADLRPGETDKEGFRCSCCYWHVHEQHKGTCGLAVACRGYQVVVTDCKCAAGLVASPLGLQGPQMSGCVCMHDSGVCGCLVAPSAIFESFSLSNYSLVKCETKALFSLPVFSPLEHQLSALAVSAWPPRALVSDSLADIMTTRGQPAPQYHVLSQKHSGIDCFVLCLYKAVNYSCAPVSVRGCQSNTTPE